MTNTIICEKCNSNQFSVQKRGYNINRAIVGFVVVSVFLFFSWKVSLSYENSINEADRVSHINEIQRAAGIEPDKALAYEDSYLLWGATIIVLGLSLLFGFYDANSNQRICISCGDKKLLDVSQNNNIVSQ